MPTITLLISNDSEARLRQMLAEVRSLNTLLHALDARCGL
jgi:hypothetical protein